MKIDAVRIQDPAAQDGMNGGTEDARGLANNSLNANAGDGGDGGYGGGGPGGSSFALYA